MNNHFDLYDLFFMNKKYFRIVISFTIVAFLISIFYSLYSQPLYKSYISIYQTRNESMLPSSMSSFTGVASSLGFNFSNGENIYNIPDVINSRKLKKVITSKNWSSNIHSKPIDLVSYWELDKDTFFSNIKSIFFSNKPSTDFHLQNMAIDKFSTRISIYEHESGMITVSILMEDELIAANIVNFISTWIQDYISNEMSFKAKKNRVFIENQLNSAKMDLFLSEEDLSDFQKKHSITDDNPEVILARARLMRNVEVNQQVYVTLRQQFELNKIEELKEKPIINILDEGDIPTRKSKPLRSLIVISWTIIAFFISNFAIYCYHYMYINKK
tara:strand:+ start:5504 stop:6490 length:987 start_codon:yes stop_codon:yes gene_type:complete